MSKVYDRGILPHTATGNPGKPVSTMNMNRFLHLFLLFVSVPARAEWVFEQSHFTNASFRAVHAVTAKVVWVGGSRGACLRTVDGGQNWEELAVTGDTNVDFRGIFGFDAQSAIVMSAGEAERGLARMYRTSDGGKSWQLVLQTWQKGVFLDGTAFWDKTNGLVFGDPIGGQWYLLKTADGGRTWARMMPERSPPMLPNEAAFAAGNSAMVMQGSSRVWIASGGAESARVFYSADRGQTWEVSNTPMPSGATAGIFGLRFWDSQHGIGAGGDHKMEKEPPDNIIVKSNGGVTWQKGAATDPPGLKETVVMLPGKRLLAVGPSGTCVSKDFGKSWRKIDLSAFHSVSCADGQCWAVGGNGVIAKWRGTAEEIAKAPADRLRDFSRNRRCRVEVQKSFDSTRSSGEIISGIREAGNRRPPQHDRMPIMGIASGSARCRARLPGSRRGGVRGGASDQAARSRARSPVCPGE
jgi:photosystem II stability/assembly factor-like uncharacterized protein